MGSTLPTSPVPSISDPSSPTLVPSTFVVPLDGSDFSLRALPIASRFAARFDADVVALTTPMTVTGGDRSAMPDWLAELVHDDRYAGLRAIVAEQDDPVDAVSALVAAHPDSVVCMATHARGVIGTAALGSVAQHVVREVGVPVLLVGPHCAEPASEQGPIVVSHDGSQAADAVLAPARAWAHRLDVALVLVHVYHPLDVPSAQDPTGAIRPALELLGPGARAEVVASSFPPGVIRDLAHELDACAIAMSTHGRTGAARIVMGNVASWVTRESPCPVLAVRPAGLVP
jgi:nucleotide-binding universal stress UspA family protein